MGHGAQGGSAQTQRREQVPCEEFHAVLTELASGILNRPETEVFLFEIIFFFKNDLNKKKMSLKRN